MPCQGGDPGSRLIGGPYDGHNVVVEQGQESFEVLEQPDALRQWGTYSDHPVKERLLRRGFYVRIGPRLFQWKGWGN